MHLTEPTIRKRSRSTVCQRVEDALALDVVELSIGGTSIPYAVVGSEQDEGSGGGLHLVRVDNPLLLTTAFNPDDEFFLDAAVTDVITSTTLNPGFLTIFAATACADDPTCPLGGVVRLDVQIPALVGAPLLFPACPTSWSDVSGGFPVPTFATAFVLDESGTTPHLYVSLYKGEIHKFDVSTTAFASVGSGWPVQQPNMRFTAMALIGSPETNGEPSIVASAGPKLNVYRQFWGQCNNFPACDGTDDTQTVWTGLVVFERATARLMGSRQIDSPPFVISTRPVPPGGSGGSQVAAYIDAVRDGHGTTIYEAQEFFEVGAGGTTAAWAVLERGSYDLGGQSAGGFMTHGSTDDVLLVDAGGNDWRIIAAHERKTSQFGVDATPEATFEKADHVIGAPAVWLAAWDGPNALVLGLTLNASGFKMLELNPAHPQFMPVAGFQCTHGNLYGADATWAPSNSSLGAANRILYASNRMELSCSASSSRPQASGGLVVYDMNNAPAQVSELGSWTEDPLAANPDPHLNGLGGYTDCIAVETLRATVTTCTSSMTTTTLRTRWAS